MLLTTKTFIPFLLTAICLLMAFPLTSKAKELLPGLNKVVLPNGLTAIVKESHRAPVVAVQVWVKAGSVYETDKEAGITHLIEHMIFKGTEKRGPGELARTIESVGGTINAYTSVDYTVYHCVVPKQYLDTALDVLSDSIFHSTFEDKELEREKKVVLEEIRMREDNPQARLYKMLMETAYKVYPYRRPVIGYPETVKSFTRQDILNYMARRYRPALMSVVVAGDIEPTRALSLIRDTFGTAKAIAAEPVQEPSEPIQEKPRLSTETMDINEGYLAITFSGIPDFNSPDVPAIDVLAALLGRGDSSRLTQALKERLQLVHSIDASAFTPAGPGLFEVTATLDSENIQPALSQILKEIYRLQNEQVLDEELQKAKIQVETGFVYSQETMEGEARKLGLFQTMAGDPAAEKTYLEGIRKVSAEDIQRIARKYLGRKNFSVCLIAPEGHVPAFSTEDLGVMAQEAELEASGIEAGGTGILVRPVRRLTLPNGLTVLVLEAPEVPTVAVRLVFPGGIRYERHKDNGIFNFLARTWTKGTDSHSALGISEMIDGMGGNINGFSGQNTFGLQGRFLAQNLEKGLGLFTEIALTPTFPTNEVEKVRQLIIAQIRQQEDYLPGVAIREFNRLLFSPHPYGMNPLGTVETVKALTAADLQKVYKEYAVPERGVLSIVGDVNTDEVISEIKTLFGGWQVETDFVLPTPPAPEPLDSPRFLNLKREKQQDHIVLGFPGTTISSPERYPLEVLNAILSGQGGRLFIDLRDKESLAYSVTSFLGLGLDYGSFAFYVACAPEKKNKAQKALWKEIYRVLEEPVDDAELERAKKWLIGKYEIGLQTNGAQAMDMALNELYGLGYNYPSEYIKQIEKVTSAQVMDAAKKFLNTEAYVLVIVGP